MADALREAIGDLVREHLTAANDVPQWRRIDAEAGRRGFSSTSAFRSWCLARGVELREDNHKDTWVSPAAVDAAVAALPLVRGPRPVSKTTDAIDRDIDQRSNSR